MDQILDNLPFCFVYVEDILIFSPDEGTHVQNLRQVFELSRLHGLHMGLPNCVFAVPELKFLGHNLYFELLGLRPEAKDSQLEVEDVYHVAEARLDTLSHRRKQVSTC